MTQMEAFEPHEVMPGHFLREGVQVTPWEALAYDEIVIAADAGAVCPLNLDLEMLMGCNSGSVASTVVARLEAKGLIAVERFQRFRRVQVRATGKWTARSPSQHVDRPHVPRGTKSRGPLPTDRKPYKTRLK